MRHIFPMPEHLNYWAILVSAAAYFFLGAIWYGIFGKSWVALRGKTMEEVKQQATAMPYLVAAVTSLACAAMMSVVLRAAGWDTSIGHALVIAVLLWVGFALCTAAKHYAFSMLPPKLLAIDYGYDLIGFLIMAAILASWK